VAGLEAKTIGDGIAEKLTLAGRGVDTDFGV
jgi:hypothetical protein